MTKCNIPGKPGRKKLKIAIVLIRNKMRFGIWLAGINKQNKAEYWNRFKAKDLKDYHMIDKIISK